MKRWIAALTFVLAGPLAAAAQAGPHVRVIPRAGAVTPADWFYVEYKHYGTLPTEWTEASILQAPVVGLGVELEFPDAAVWVRGEVVRTVDARLKMTHVVQLQPSGFEPARQEKTFYRVDARVTSGTLDAAFPTVFRVGPVQPYVTAGLGATHYDFDTAPFTDLSDRVVLPQPGTVWAANLGVGAKIHVLGVALDLQIRDAVNRYWERTQHNVMWLGGVSWELF